MRRVGGIVGLACVASALVADVARGQIVGQVLGAGAPIAGSTVTLWVPSDTAPRRIAETKSDADGHFALTAEALREVHGVSYIIAKGGEPKARAGSGDNPAIALLAVLPVDRPTNVVVNEFSTVASVWTNLQFLTGDGMNGRDISHRRSGRRAHPDRRRTSAALRR